MHTFFLYVESSLFLVGLGWEPTLYFPWPNGIPRRSSVTVNLAFLRISQPSGLQLLYWGD